MKFADRKYLLKEAQRTLDESDSTAAFCLCQRWILKDAIALLKEQEAVVRCKDCKNNGKSQCPLCSTGDPYLDSKPNDNWYCADGKLKDT